MTKGKCLILPASVHSQASIHESIRKREIIMPQEHVGQAGFDYAWKSLMQRAATADKTLVCNTSEFDVAMFNLSWRPVISAIASAFTGSAQDEYVIQRAVAGFRECAVLAGKFNLPEVFDSVVLSLSNSTGLLDDTDEGYQSANHPVVERENQSITVSPLSVRLGTSFRSQLATVVLFTIVNGHGDAIREGWGQVRIF
jgi:golgi-specific brefeldin A-resistance guanine nucleotide exchange factor 1